VVLEPGEARIDSLSLVWPQLLAARGDQDFRRIEGEPRPVDRRRLKIG
jgi:hypothetical protein